MKTTKNETNFKKLVAMATETKTNVTQYPACKGHHDIYHP